MKFPRLPLWLKLVTAGLIVLLIYSIATAEIMEVPEVSYQEVDGGIDLLKAKDLHVGDPSVNIATIALQNDFHTGKFEFDSATATFNNLHWKPGHSGGTTFILNNPNTADKTVFKVINGDTYGTWEFGIGYTGDMGDPAIFAFKNVPYLGYPFALDHKANMKLSPSAGWSMGTGAAGVLLLESTYASAPTSSPANSTQLYVKDKAAGDSRLYIRSETQTGALIFGNNQISTEFGELTLAPSISEVNVTGAMDASGGYKDNGVIGMDSTLNLRLAGGAEDCTITVSGGIITASSC